MSNGPLPPDVQAVRKARWNSDMIKLCSTPKGIHTHPTAQGIGLYTHVAGPKTTRMNPHFASADSVDGEVALLTLGGPRQIRARRYREPPNAELMALYKELQDAVQAEEKIWSDQRIEAEKAGNSTKGVYRMSLDTLNKKYGDINARSAADAIPQVNDGDRDTRRHSGAATTTTGGSSRERRVSFASQPDSRRQTIGDILAARRNSISERRGSISSNEYHEDRDPRRRGR
ncbi:hypothetical protein C7974DRAFT_386206 [Boeremia exigua]|uniref:uncharacterized protein n=1 Tax=Boeremia exigua TaxID=749465 RepID=UPI001E8E7D0A|nr:uncharacterized protein C7974DRAFT_386206 [Boeremia exigua]KAH6642814.1 hypothetical protein C7974DRAFT_386206 [Boeremia exigua]